MIKQKEEGKNYEKEMVSSADDGDNAGWTDRVREERGQ